MDKHGINTDKVNPAQIPESKRDDYCRKYGGKSGHNLRFGLRAGMELLLCLEQDKGVKSIGHRFFNCLNNSNMEKLLDARNHSILAHGDKPMNREKYRKLLENALYLVNLDESKLMHFPEFPI